METSTILWIVVGILVLLAIVAVAVRMSGQQKLNRQRAKADEIRQEAAEHEPTVRRHEAEAAEQEALARQARAEADRKAAEAERLQIDAQERAALAADTRAEHQERLRTADDVDPDVEKSDMTDGAPTQASDRRDVGHESDRLEDPQRSV